MPRVRSKSLSGGAVTTRSASRAAAAAAAAPPVRSRAQRAAARDVVRAQSAPAPVRRARRLPAPPIVSRPADATSRSQITVRSRRRARDSPEEASARRKRARLSSVYDVASPFLKRGLRKAIRRGQRKKQRRPQRRDSDEQELPAQERSEPSGFTGRLQPGQQLQQDFDDGNGDAGQEEKKEDAGQEEKEEDTERFPGAVVIYTLNANDPAPDELPDMFKDEVLNGVANFVLRLTTEDGRVFYHTIDPANEKSTRRALRALDITRDWTQFILWDDEWGSDPLFDMGREGSRPRQIQLLRLIGSGIRRDNRSVAYLRYVLTNEAKDLDLTRYQLYSIVGQERDSTHCLLHSLRMAGVTESQLVDVDWKFIGNLTHVSRKSLDAVAASLNCRFKVVPLNVNTRNDDGFTRSRTVIYNKKGPAERTIDLGIIHHHLFIDERTRYSGYFIRNIAKCRAAAAQLGWTDKREERVCSDPLKRGYKFAKPEQCMTSVALMKYLFFLTDQVLVIPDSSGAFTKKRDEAAKTSYLTRDIVEQSQKPFQVSTKTLDNLPMFACDIEAAVGGAVHVAILAAALRMPDSKTLPPACELKEQEKMDKYLTERCGEESNVIVRYGWNCLSLLFDTLADAVLRERGSFQPDEEEEDGAGEEKKRAPCPRALCYFHNLRYDSKHLFAAFRTTRMVQKEQTLYSLSFFHAGVVFQCIDSLKVVDMALGSFQSKLNLPSCFRKRGDLISYSFFTTDHVTEGYHTLETSLHDYVNSNTSLHSPAEKHAFHSLLLDELLSRDEYNFKESNMTFNSNLLYAEYLRWDCRVLAAGLIAVHYSMNSVQGLTKPVAVLGKMTLPSIAKTMFWQEGCFNADETKKPCIAMSGLLRRWLHRAIAGGRVMPSLTCPFGFIPGRFQYLDVCSLYPSSVVRICRELGGFPASRCQLLDKDAGQFEEAFLFDPTKVMTFVVRVKITAIRREQACGIPALSYQPINSNARHYVNSMPSDGEPIETYLGKIGLEDALSIHDIDYEVLEGVFFPAEGGQYASSYGPTVQSLYKRRSHVERNDDGSVKLQVKKTAEGEAIKRLLNSGAYGIFIQKPNDIKLKFMAQEDLRTYVYNQFHSVYRFYSIGKTWAVEEYDNDSGAMPCHWGLMVLEMSKRIMNEVLSCLSSIGGVAYYTDTDSVTVADKDVEPLAAEFRKRYGKELYGEELAQMHSDFSLYDSQKKAIPEKNVVSTGFACAGKKSYLHLLEGADKDGKMHYGYKVSAKGITSAGMMAMALKMCDDDDRNQPLHMQQRSGLKAMFSEISKTDSAGFSINLFPPESNRQKFVYTKDSVSTSSGLEFRRILRNTRQAVYNTRNSVEEC